MKKEPEIFKPIKNYEEYYEVSNWGCVKSLAKTWSVGRKGDTILKPGHRKKGYDFVVLCVDKIKKYVTIHRLVAQHFCDNPNNYDVVNHLDSDIYNNYYKNLEWTTSSGNTIHAYKNGRRVGMKGDRNGMTKLTVIQVQEIRDIYKKTKISQDKLGKQFGVSQTQVGRIVHNERWNYIK